MRREQLVVVVMLAILAMFFGFESYLLRYRGEHYGVMAKVHDFMAPGLFGIGWSLFLFLAAAIILFLYITRINLRDNALSILKTKYAKGEISREEYLEKLKDLMHEH